MFEKTKRGLIVLGLNPIVFLVGSFVGFVILNLIFPNNSIVYALGAALGLFNLFVVFSAFGLGGLAVYLLLLILLGIFKATQMVGA